jgi:hypothetical protein
MNRAAIIAAYERHEKAQGGLAKADPLTCLHLAALECGVSDADARAVLIEHWAGMRG